MLLWRHKPLTPGARNKVSMRIWKSSGYSFSRLSCLWGVTSGSSLNGNIICSGSGGGFKHMYKFVNFWMRQIKGQAMVLNVSYDSFSTADLALLYFKSGMQCYTLAADGLKVGSLVKFGSMKHHIKGNLGGGGALQYMTPGTFVFNLELVPGCGGQYISSAGTHGKVLSPIEKGTASVRLPSKKMLTVDAGCTAMIGSTSNIWYKSSIVGTAGRNSSMGWRPKVRGTAKNAVDHPHGGKSGPGRSSVTPWGTSTK